MRYCHLKASYCSVFAYFYLIQPTIIFPLSLIRFLLYSSLDLVYYFIIINLIKLLNIIQAYSDLYILCLNKQNLLYRSEIEEVI